jgi:hypothetical protein
MSRVSLLSRRNVPVPTVPSPPASEWVFRYGAGELFEFPDLRLPTGGRSRGAVMVRRWVATRWPDPHAAGGWAALTWRDGERGVVIPGTLAVGDVVEFGIAAHDRSGRIAAMARWFGHINYATDLALVVTGPFPHPQDAWDAGQRLVDEIRLAQLPAPNLSTPPIAPYEPGWVDQRRASTRDVDW